MGRIIPLNPAQHPEAQALLPWYATGQLDAADRARLEAHLAGCAECQADLILERRLVAEVAALPLQADHSWAQLRRQLPAMNGIGFQIATAVAQAFGKLSWRGGLGWALAAQAALLLLALGLLVLPSGKPAAYHALGQAPAAAPAGNVIVVFRPDTSERDLRRTLLDSDARLVGGPTAADAYVLRVPAKERASVLGQLRAAPAVVMAEPIDPGTSP